MPRPTTSPTTPTPSSYTSHPRNSFAASSSSSHSPFTSPSFLPQSARRSISTPYTPYAPVSGIPVAASPSPHQHQGGGGFRGLRSFLPFTKQNNTNSNGNGSAPVTPAKSTGGFGFGSVRRSMQRDRDKEREKEREREREMPVIAIGPSSSTSTSTFDSSTFTVEQLSRTPKSSLSLSNMRRSVSLSKLGKEKEREGDVDAWHVGSVRERGGKEWFHGEGDEMGMLKDATRDGEDTHSFQFLRPPSPGPPLSLSLSAELSTIIEADSSGLSLGNHKLPSRSDSFSTSTSSSANSPISRPNGTLAEGSKWPSTSSVSLGSNHKPSPSHSDPYHPYSHSQSLLHEPEPDLDLSSSQITAQVLNALVSTGGAWGEVVVIDADAQEVDEEGRLTHSANTNEEDTVTRRKMDPGLERLLNSGSGRQREREWDREKRRSTGSNGKEKETAASVLPTPPSTSGSLQGKKPSFLPRLKHNSLSSSSSSPSPPLFSTPQTPTSAGSTKIQFLPPASPVRGTEQLASPIRGTYPPASPIRGPFPPLSPRIQEPHSHSQSPAHSHSQIPNPSPSRTVIIHNGDTPLGSPVSAIWEGERRLGLRPTGIEPTPTPTIKLESSTPLKPLWKRKGERRWSTSPERPLVESGGRSPRVSIDSSRPSFSSERTTTTTTTPTGSSSRLGVYVSPSDTSASPGASAYSPSPLKAARLRKRSMSVQEQGGLSSHSGGIGLGPRPGSSLSAKDGEALRRGESLTSRGEFSRDRDRGGERERERERERPILKRPEWLGPRTAKAFRAAGLLDFDKNRERDRERDRERETQSEYDAYTTPRGSYPHSNPRLVVSPMMRSASEYNPRAGSRMGFSDVGEGARRRGSESYVSGGGLMESPTFTTSSRETPRSSSTAPTSISSSFGYLGRDREREREREDLKEMKDKHAVETGALLSALSDSQRTARMLREENSDLRERLERLSEVETENVELRRVVGDLRREVGMLRRKVGMGDGERVTPVQRRAGEGRMLWGRRWEEKGFEHAPSVRDVSDLAFHLPADEEDKEENMEDAIMPNVEEDNEHLITPSIQSTPAKRQRTVHTRSRRCSTSSSVFHMPPSNMTMLMSEDSSPAFGTARSISASDAGEVSASFHIPNKSITSSNGVSISPTTENFSMVTGSPGSLYLRPEHEMLLGEMESLDLGRIPDTLDTGREDDW